MRRSWSAVCRVHREIGNTYTAVHVLIRNFLCTRLAVCIVTAYVDSGQQQLLADVKVI